MQAVTWEVALEPSPPTAWHGTVDSLHLPPMNPCHAGFWFVGTAGFLQHSFVPTSFSNGTPAAWLACLPSRACMDWTLCAAPLSPLDHVAHMVEGVGCGAARRLGAAGHQGYNSVDASHRGLLTLLSSMCSSRLLWWGDEGLSSAATARLSWLANLRLHLDCSASSPWHVSHVLLFFLLAVHPQVRPIPHFSLPSCVNVIFPTDQVECWVYDQLVNMYVWRSLIPSGFKNAFMRERGRQKISDICVPQQHIMFSVYSLYTLVIMCYSNAWIWPLIVRW
jgi:hypothetical protein